LNKQIKDKEEHEKKITEDLKRDEEKRASLEKKIQEYTREMECQKASIDEHNKQYYDLNKSKDQCQATRKEQ
jgi:structural maintenance of chromosome 3 (chondroitin sulfate proteoglycan 6)